MRNWKKSVVLVVIGIAMVGIVAGSIYWYYTPYLNTIAFFPHAESGLECHLSACGETWDGENNFRFNAVNHVFYYEYTFSSYCNTAENNLNVSIVQDGGALTLRFDFNFTAVATCVCSFKLNGYVVGLSGGTYEMTVVNGFHRYSDPVQNTTVGTFQVTI